MKGFLAIALMVALAFAGCASKGTTSSSATTTPSQASSTTASTTTSTSASSSTTTSSSKGPNHPPVISSFSAMRANKTTLNFMFMFSATDSDGDHLNWTLDPTGKIAKPLSGSGVPASVNYTYAAAGLFNATLRVTDGQATVNQTLAVNATVGSGPLQVADLKWTTPNGGCGASYPVWAFGRPTAGVTWAELQVDPKTHGLPYRAIFTFSDPSTKGVAQVGLDFYAPTTADVGVGVPAPVPGPANPAFEYVTSGGGLGPKPEIDGKVGPDADHAVFFDCAAGPGTSVHYVAG
jgi:hypothetical protein